MQTQQQVSPQVIAEIAKEVVARLRVQIQPAPAAQSPATRSRRQVCAAEVGDQVRRCA